jgi:hypothetical protein
MDELRNALETIRDLADSYLQNLDPRSEPWIVLTNMAGPDGSLNPAAADKIVMSVCNLTRETGTGAFNGNDKLAYSAPPLDLGVHLMFAANFDGNSYAAGLAVLSRLIGYFQQSPDFTRENAPGLASGLDRLTLEFENLSPTDLNHVMCSLGIRYLPSGFYRMRMIPLAQEPSSS